MPQSEKTKAAVKDYIRQLRTWQVGTPKINIGALVKKHGISRMTLHRALNTKGKK